MGIAEEWAAGPVAPKRRASVLRVWLASLPDDDREAAVAMLGSSAWITRRVFESFTANGLRVSFSHFDRLRRERAWE